MEKAELVCTMKLFVLVPVLALFATAMATEETFDIIIVGGGTAGCLVAHRLSENTQWRVLLLEAGNATKQRWNYPSVPRQGVCNGAGCANFPSKGLGSTVGSTYSRGSARDYDDWEALGAKGWAYKDVLPFFKKWENNTEHSELYHGRRGPVSVETLPTNGNLSALVGALQDLGFTKGDVNGARQEGRFMITQTWASGLRRWSMKKLLIDPIVNRTNLVVRTNTLVTRILIEGKKAIGVQYKSQGALVTVRASREVVLSAGPYNSPQLLILSGVGPKEQLKRLKVPLVADLPVGENLQQHFKTRRAVRYDMPRAVSVADERFRGLIAITAFHKLASSLAADPRPDVNYRFQGIGADGKNNDTHYQAIDIETIVQNVASRGRVYLNSSDPMLPPVIDFNGLQSQSDRDILIEGMTYALSLAQTATFQKAGIKLNSTRSEECANHSFATAAYWKCMTVVNSVSYGHGSGTCRMGPASVSTSVVDPTLRVIGVNNLCVVDSSVFPVLPRANPIGPTLMVAEKGTALIKQRHGVAA